MAAASNIFFLVSSAYYSPEEADLNALKNRCFGLVTGICLIISKREHGYETMDFWVYVYDWCTDSGSHNTKIS